MKYFDSIKLNNSTYAGNQLLSQIKSKITDENTPDWEKSIFKFIEELVNEKDYILAQSSGTTGVAKQIKLKKKALIESAVRTQNYFNLTSYDNALLCLPASYIAGKMMIVRACVTGFNLRYVQPTSTPLDGLSESIDFTAFTPHQLSSSLDNKNLNKLQNIIVGGAPVSEKLFEQIQNLKCKIFETYGMTETCSHIAIKPINGGRKTEYFTVLPGFEISLNERDCLVIELSDGTKLETNDIIEIKADTFKWLGRYDNVINSGGIKLFPEQIEKKLQHVIKQDFIIASEKHNTLGEQVILILKLGKEESRKINIEKLQNSLVGILSSYERPKKLYLLPEFIETSSGKIKRKETIDSIKLKRGYVF